MGLLLVTVQVRVVEFPTTTLVRVAVTSTSGGAILERLSDKIFIIVDKGEIMCHYNSGFILPDVGVLLEGFHCTCLHAVLQKTDGKYMQQPSYLALAQ